MSFGAYPIFCQHNFSIFTYYYGGADCFLDSFRLPPRSGVCIALWFISLSRIFYCFGDEGKANDSRDNDGW